MDKTTLALALATAFLATSAFATPPGGTPDVPFAGDNIQRNVSNNTNDISNANNINNTSNNDNNLAVDSRNANSLNGEQNQGQRQNSSANNNGNQQVSNYNNPKQYRNTPSVALFVPPPTATCQNVVGGAGMMPGVGISMSGSYTNENCEVIELAKAMASIGQLDSSMEILCASKHGKLASSCRNEGDVLTEEQPLITDSITTNKVASSGTSYSSISMGSAFVVTN